METVTRITKRKNVAIISSDEDQEPKNDMCINETAEYAHRKDIQECRVVLPRLNERRTKKKVKRIVSKFVDSSDEESQQTETSNIQKWKSNLEKLCIKKRNKNRSFKRYVLGVLFTGCTCKPKKNGTHVFPFN